MRGLLAQSQGGRGRFLKPPTLQALSLWPASPGSLDLLFSSWAGPKEAPLGSEAAGKQALLCGQPLDPEALLSHPALGSRVLGRRSPPPPSPPQHPSFPVQHHPSPSPQSKECASGHCGTCSQSLLAHFTRAFTNWPPSRGCCLGFGSKGADRGPSSPQFLMLHFAPTPRRRLHHGGSRNPGVGAGSPRAQLYCSDTQHYGDV